MAFSLNSEQNVMENGGGVKLDKFLKERQTPKPSRDRIVHNSQEEFSKTRQNSADADCLSRSQKERKLDDFLKNKPKHRRRIKKVTISDVRSEAAKILEEFLQEQLAQQAIQTSSPEYQRVVEVSITENTTPSGDSSSFLASSSNILRENSIPYADESDGELRKSESLPHDEFIEFQGLDNNNKKGLPIHHEKSKSAPHSQNEDIWIQSPSRKRPSTIRPPPPPPPGTPHTPSENSSNGSNSHMHPVPYIGRTPDSSVPCSSDSIDTFSERKKSPYKLNIPTPPSSHSRSTTPLSDNGARHKTVTKQPYAVSPRHVKPGSETSSDTDSDHKHHMQGRKKKSMFKKAQQRVQNLLRIKKNRESDFREDEEDGYEGSVDEKRSKHRKKHKKRDKEKHDGNYKADEERKVLEERHIHRNRNVHQTHSGGDSRNVIRSEDTTETVDIVNKKEKKHIEKKWKMKESSGNEGGVLSRLKRLTSRDKGRKNHVKESKSAEFVEDEADSYDGGPNYSRAISVPEREHTRPTQLGLDEPDHSRLKMYTNRRGFEYSNVDSEDLHGTRQVTATQVVCREEKDVDIRRHSSHLDIVDFSGTMLERLYFDADGKQLPKNESFLLNREEDIVERVVDDHGRVKVIRDVTHHDHMEVTQDSEAGAGKELTAEEKEELYGRIASRLATIGDNLMAEKEEQSRSTSESPQSKLSEEQKSSPEQEFTKTTLTPLEMELRDELRKVADDMDAKLAANARQAALHITGLVTYNHFKNIVQDSVAQEQGWAQIAAVFHVTKRAIKLAGASGALAMRIKEMSLKYIEDTFAHWVVDQGGWESMLSEAESETDSELD